MNLTEKIAYIRGLCEGLGIEADTKENKVLLAMLDLLDDMAEAVTSIDEDVSQLYDEVDAIDADLDNLEEEVFGFDYGDLDGCDCGDCDFDDDDDDDDCDCDECAEHHHHHLHIETEEDDKEDETEESEEDDTADEEDFDGEDMYEFTCPACGESLVVDEDTLFNSNFTCPACGLKFDDILDSMEDEEED